jgi:hypothetical protein
VAATHFFVGLGAGVALLTVPVLLMAPGLDVPGHVVAWIDSPPSVTQVATPVVASRPVRGYVPGEATQGPDAPPPTLVAPFTPAPALPAPQQPPPASTLTAAPLPLPTLGAAVRTGVIRSGGAPVTVRRAAGIDSPNDQKLADGSPVLVSYGPELHIGGEAWRAVRGLNGVAGWVPSAMVAVDNR